nr:MAG TPA: hypothetical protein [Caudoviricetes sp.]
MSAIAKGTAHPLGCIIPLHFLGSQPRRLGIPLPLGCISPSSAGSLAFGYSYPVAGGRLFPLSSVRQRARGGWLPPVVAARSAGSKQPTTLCRGVCHVKAWQR